MDLIKVEINEEKNIISIFNNGKGIPIQMHKVNINILILKCYFFFNIGRKYVYS